MFKIKRLKTIDEVIEFTKIFNKSIGYSNVPWQYHASGKCYALIDNKEIKAGFCLIPGYFNLRAVLQMPENKIKEFYDNNTRVAHSMCDLTGYFINNLSFRQGLIFTLFLVFRCFFYCKKYFIYTYPISDVALKNYYGKGNPNRIHSGKPEYLLGHSNDMDEENIEILNKYGIVKIFYYRTKRILKLKLRKSK